MLTITKQNIQSMGGPSADLLSRPALRARLEAAGFPPPLPGMKRPLRWSRVAVERWLNGAGAAAETIRRVDDDGDELAARLAARSRALVDGEVVS